MGILRCILALSVLVSHSNPIFGVHLVDADAAVQAFYIISGFYMALILNEKYVHQANAYRLFITNRFLRLFPIYWMILALSLIFYIVAYYHPHGSNIETPLQVFTTNFHHLRADTMIFLVVTNLFLFFQDAVMFLGLNPTGGLFFTTDFRTTNPQLHTFLMVPQAWTIGVELLFYLIAPFIVRRSQKTHVAIIITTGLLRVVLRRVGLDHDPWSYRFFPTELIFFVLGSLAYSIYRNIRNRPLRRWQLSIPLIVLFTATLLYETAHFPMKRYFYCLLVFVAVPFLFLWTHKSKIDSYIGELSYPMYMCHMLVRSVLLWLGVSSMNNVALPLVVITILLSLALNQWVANPVERIRQARVRAASSSAIAAHGSSEVAART